MVLGSEELEKLSCECYAVVRKETDRLLEFLLIRAVPCFLTIFLSS